VDLSLRSSGDQCHLLADFPWLAASAKLSPVPSPSRTSILRCLAAIGLLIASNAWPQSPAERVEDEAVGSSINYVFASDLGSGVYELDGRTLQIYKLTY